jgi:hypothetical protein
VAQSTGGALLAVEGAQISTEYAQGNRATALGRAAVIGVGIGAAGIKPAKEFFKPNTKIIGYKTAEPETK